MMKSDSRSLLEQALERKATITVVMVDGTAHRGCIKALDANFVVLSGNSTLMLNFHQALKVELGNLKAEAA